MEGRTRFLVLTAGAVGGGEIVPGVGVVWLGLSGQAEVIDGLVKVFLSQEKPPEIYSQLRVQWIKINGVLVGGDGLGGRPVGHSYQ